MSGANGSQGCVREETATRLGRSGPDDPGADPGRARWGSRTTQEPSLFHLPRASPFVKLFGSPTEGRSDSIRWIDTRATVSLSCGVETPMIIVLKPQPTPELIQP